MAKIKQMPINQRPREKALRYGIDSLTDAELLAIIIQSGTKSLSAIDIAYSLISNFNGIENIKKKRINELMEIKGIKKATALKLAVIFEINKRVEINLSGQIKTKIENIDALVLTYKKLLMEQKQEFLVVIALNRRNEIIKESILFKGSEDQILFSIKDIFRFLLNENAYSYYLLHNHLSENPMPSNFDIATTLNLKKQSEKIGLKLKDHIIISSNRYYSFSKNKIFECRLN